jgi:hypothetical protein
LKSALSCQFSVKSQLVALLFTAACCTSFVFARD